MTTRHKYVLPALRAKRPTSTRRQEWARDCSEPGCLRSTEEKKPFCSAHVLQHAYAASVADELERRDEFLRAAARGTVEARHVLAAGTVIEDVVSVLEEHGTVTVARLAERLGLEVESVAGVVQLLVAAGCVRLVRSRDGARRGLRGISRSFVELVRKPKAG